MRIHHNAAFKILQKNGFLDLCPSDLRPYGPFPSHVRVYRADVKDLAEFKGKINEFRYYNCCYTRCGVAFYDGDV